MELPYPADVACALKLVCREVRVKFSDFAPQALGFGGVPCGSRGPCELHKLRRHFKFDEEVILQHH